VTAEKLSEKFEISVRTVYRDVRALDEIGIPVSFEAGKGYFIVQGYFLPPVSFTAEEANALILATSLADRFGDKTIARLSDLALQKIRAVLHSAEKDKTEKLANSIRVLPPEKKDPKSVNYLSEIQTAISGKIILQLDYTDAKDQKTRREVEPIGMIYYTDQWHLIAWCWTRLGYRDFIVKNINTLVSTSKPFRKSDHISVNEHIASWK
jgi:predicted DNA-binding transcriptional regulator YafY